MRVEQRILVAYLLTVLLTVVAGKVTLGSESRDEPANSVTNVQRHEGSLGANPMGTQNADFKPPKNKNKEEQGPLNTTRSEHEDTIKPNEIPEKVNLTSYESRTEYEIAEKNFQESKLKIEKTYSNVSNNTPEVASKLPEEESSAIDAGGKKDLYLHKFDNVSLDEGKITYRGFQVLRVALKNKEQKKLIRQLEEKGDLDTWVGNGTAIDILVRRTTVLDVLKARKVTYDVVLEDLQKAIEEENPPLAEDEWSELEGRKVETHRQWTGDGLLSPFHTWIFNEVPPISDFIRIRGYQLGDLRKKKTKRKKIKTKNKKKPSQRGHRMTWQMYHRMSDIHGYLDYLTMTYPDICSQEIIGYSIEKKPLKVLKISSGKPGSKAVWVDSGIHAREWITPATSTYVISQMVENGDGTHGVDWYFLPLTNPDGYEHSHTIDRLWRKNRSNPHKGPCAGTDLNRNFGYRWGGQGSSQQPCRETYAGSGPFSEPETNAVKEFVMKNAKNLKGYVSLHSYGQYILYPWGYDRKVPPDYSDLHRVGRAMAQAMKALGGQNYKVGSAAATLYPAAGGSDDWAKGTAKIKYAYTIELRDTGRHGFVLPAQFIMPTAREAYAALKVLANEVGQL